MVVIGAERTAYSANDIRNTFTVAELIEALSQYDPNEKVVLSHDNGFTYGGITWDNISDEYEE